MSNYLLLLEHSLRDDTVVDHLRALRDRGNAAFSLLVPERPAISDEDIFLTFDDDEYTRSPRDRSALLARWLLHDAIDSLHRAGIDSIIDAEVGDPDPMRAVEDALEQRPYDAVIVVTGRTRLAGWLHRDIASRLDRRLEIEVIHLRAAPVVKA